MRKIFLVISCLFMVSATVLMGCNQKEVSVGEANTDTTILEAQGEHGKALQIVTTFPPLFAHVANIIDENDSLTNLVPPGTSVHTWQPKPSDLVAMEEADMIVTNGLGLEEFLEDYLSDLEKKGVLIVDTSEGVAPMEFEEDDHEEDDHEEDSGNHHHEGPDPHIRLDVVNAQLQVGNITESLIRLDTAQKETYTKNSQLYRDSLARLDQDITTLISDATIESFIVFHDAYQYFLQAYDLADKQVGLVQEFHGDNPSQKEIAELIEIIMINDVKTIYTEPQFNPSIVQSLKQETGVQTREIDPIGSELSKNGYIQMITELGDKFANN